MLSEDFDNFFQSNFGFNVHCLKKKPNFVMVRFEILHRFNSSQRFFPGIEIFHLFVDFL